MRAKDGDEYIAWMIDLLSGNFRKYNGKYDFKSFDNFSQMYNELKIKSKSNPLTRLVSGYTREWVSKNDNSKYDFDIDGIKLKWNNIDAVNKSQWMQSKAAINLDEVTYYNVVQGFDLDYAGVIIGKDLYLDENNKLCIDENFVISSNQKPSKNDLNYNEKLFSWVINRYRILLSRGTKATYVYIEDEKLRNLVKDYCFKK